MTIRSVLLGLLGAVFVCGFGYFNNSVIHQTNFIGSNMPVPVYGLLILFLLFVNPLLRRFALTGKELAVTLTLTLVACVIPSSGLMRTFTPSLMVPHHHRKTQPGWKSAKVVEMLPRRMLADPSADESVALNGFMQGLGAKASGLTFRGRLLSDWRESGDMPSWAVSVIAFFKRIPWWAWTGTLAFWVPLILVLWTGLIAAAVVVHRQWAHHEHLPYPLAHFADALFPEKGRANGGVFRNRVFWLGAVPVMVIYLNNYMCTWFPRHMVAIPTFIDVTTVGALFPTYVKGGGLHTHLVRPTLHFTVIAFAYFLASDVSFSIGIGPYLCAVVVGVLASYGIPVFGGTHADINPRSLVMFGAYFGMFLVLAYTGRHYYGRIFREALFLRVRERSGLHEVWCARVFLVCCLVFAGMLTGIGIDWQLALVYTLLTMVLFLVIGRITAETGMFMIQAYWMPCVGLATLFGWQAMGPKMFLLMAAVSFILVVDAKEALMPFVVNALKVVDLRKVKVGRAAACSVLAVILGLAVAIPVTLGFQYTYGVDTVDRWAAESVPLIPFQQAVINKHRLEAQGILEKAESVSGWARFAAMSPNMRGVISFLIGFLLVAIFTLCRLRFTRWPIHPILFLVWVSWSAKAFCFSFLVGWLVKVMVTKYGGAAVYQRLKPLMYGCIVGEMLGGVIPIVIGFVYHSVTGKPPVNFSILVG